MTQNDDFRFFRVSKSSKSCSFVLASGSTLLRGSEGCLGSVAECSANLSMRAVQERGALRVIPRGEQRLTVYRAQQVLIGNTLRMSHLWCPEQSWVKSLTWLKLAAWSKNESEFLKKCSLVSRTSFLSALPGAHAPGRVHSPLSDEYYMTRRAFHSKSNSLVGGIWGQLGANFLVVKRPFGSRSQNL